MKKFLNILILSVILLSVCGSKTLAQINDIKQNSKENKQNHSNSNSSKDRSSNSNNNDNSECIGGCLNAIFSELLSDMFSGCINAIFSGKSNNDNSNNNYSNRSDINNPPFDIENNLNQNNQNQKDTAIVSENEKPVEIPSKIIEDEPVYVQRDSSTFKPKNDISFDILGNIAVGFEYSSEKTYRYYNFLPGLRLNLSWFLIDFRYNVLTEFSQDLPDAFKTLDLLFLLNLKAGDKTNIILGSGIHREQYSEMTFNQHYAGVKTILNNKQDFLDLNGRLTIDYKPEKFPFLEFGLHYNKCFTNSNKVSAFFNIGAMYQNYYSSTDIWALQAGISLNIH